MTRPRNSPGLLEDSMVPLRHSAVCTLHTGLFCKDSLLQIYKIIMGKAWGMCCWWWSSWKKWWGIKMDVVWDAYQLWINTVPPILIGLSCRTGSPKGRNKLHKYSQHLDKYGWGVEWLELSVLQYFLLACKKEALWNNTQYNYSIIHYMAKCLQTPDHPTYTLMTAHNCLGCFCIL